MPSQSSLKVCENRSKTPKGDADRRIRKIGKEEIEAKIENMEKEIISLKGKRRERALKTYRRLIIPQLREPIYLRRAD